mgnify:CR=1 FL=1
MSDSRTKKALLNSTVTLGCQFVYLILGFVCRTVFTKMLGAEYLGVSGLFTNILTILSFAELGIGSALVYRMYEPLASHNYKKLRLYMELYKRVYFWIMVVIAGIGVALIPIIPSLVSAPDVKESITLLYILYLCQTLVSYVFVYKKSILIADQKSYVVNLYYQLFNIAMNIAQCIFLVLTKNFVVYCVLNIVFNLANNIACSIRAEKEYPFLKEKAEGKLNDEEIRGLKKDVKGLLLTKIASTAFSGTDNIFISTFVGIRYVGILSNYTLFSGIVNGIMNKIFDSVTASIGNLVATGEKSRSEEILKKLFFLNTSMYGYLCLGMLVLLREFVMTIWLDAEYDLPQIVVALFLTELFLRSIHFPLYMTRTAMGCFSEFKILFAVSAGLNIILDFVLVRPLGIAGLFIATIICRGITYLADIWVVYHMQLNKSIFNYLSMVAQWLIFLAVIGFLMEKGAALISVSGFGGFVLRGIVISAIYFIAYLLLFARCDEFRFYVKMLKKFIHRKVKE